jgi:hypothetical protein
MSSRCVMIALLVGDASLASGGCGGNGGATTGGGTPVGGECHGRRSATGLFFCGI